MPSQQRILCVDDENAVRAYLRTILKTAGFDVLEAEDGVEALAILKELGGAIDLLVTDVRMPRMDGIALAEAVAARYSGIPVLFISGYSFDLTLEQQKRPDNTCAFVQKPFFPSGFLQTVQKCLGPTGQAANSTA